MNETHVSKATPSRRSWTERRPGLSRHSTRLGTQRERISALGERRSEPGVGGILIDEVHSHAP
jgi:hypothetical protein